MLPNSYLRSTYADAVETVLRHGTDKGDRTGTGTRSYFCYDLRYDLAQGFPAVTERKTYPEQGIKEMIWLLQGSRNVIPLLQMGIRWWIDWPLRRYLEETDPEFLASVTLGSGKIDTTNPGWQKDKADFERRLLSGELPERYGDLGPVYGHNLRHFEYPQYHDSLRGGGHHTAATFDQLKTTYENLKANPLSRRHVMTLWHPALVEDADLPPCHGIDIIFNAEPLSVGERLAKMPLDHAVHDERVEIDPLDENRHRVLDEHGAPRYRLSLHMTQRSCDLYLGVPANIAMYAFLLEIMAHSLSMAPGTLHITLVDCHLYHGPDEDPAYDGDKGSYDYLSHVLAAEAMLAQATNRPKPSLDITCEPKAPWLYTLDDFELVGYTYDGRISAPISV